MKRSDPDPQYFIEQARQSFDAEPVDIVTTQRLNQLRQQALQSTQPSRLSQFALPLATFASFSVIALLVILLQPRSQPSLVADNIDAFEIISSSDDLELYQNLEFYLWLEQQRESDLG